MSSPAAIPRFLLYRPARVTLLRGDVESSDTVFATQLVHRDEDGGRLWFGCPDDAVAMRYVHRGREVRIAVEDGIRLWSFATWIGGLDDGDGPRFWVTAPRDASAYEAVRQREVLRLPITVPIVVSIQGGSHAMPVRGATVNLGCGGAAVLTTTPLPAGGTVIARFAFIANTLPLVCTARVVASRPAPESGDADGGSPGFIGHLAFAGIDEETQGNILRECYRIQIQQRGNRLPRD